ncbi:MAG: hypothetical protein F6K40_10430 [Okeania sp. SIO3I5]|uniref:hypothetical protein n=1 Tax=Okeania sp. SIO3I5 TaxID=2607805 RepID=UPI0013BE0D29|nr:hypothetical protein [Okeania sp. SIO3I5]NEQ36669.1 hypothetical protein [Okeania sp. SIO3I5]
MALWSVIVYGRTKEADYRFLAIPDDFGEEEQNWARKYIHGTTVNREKLLGNPRWSLFKNHQHCVFGVTCMVQELVGSERKYEYMAKDGGRRSLHIFVGYVAQINKDFNSLRILPVLENLDFFKYRDLFTSLEKLWHLKSYQLINRKIDEYPYNFKLPNETELRGNTDVSNKFISPNFIPCLEGENKVLILPNEQEHRHNLWENCCKFFDYPHQYIPLSLCLGFPEKKDVLDGPFLNATAFDAKSPKRKSKELNEPSKITEPDKKYPSHDSYIKRLLFSPSWGYLIRIFLISIVIFSILFLAGTIVTSQLTGAIVSQLTGAIVISLLIAFYLGTKI